MQYLKGVKGTKVVEGGKFLTLSDEAFANLKVKKKNTCMQTNTMPLPSSCGHRSQALQVVAIKGWQKFISFLEKEMPISEAEMSIISKAKDDVVAKLVRVVNQLQDCE